jgi:hypothetical protein
VGRGVLGSRETRLQPLTVGEKYAVLHVCNFKSTRRARLGPYYAAHKTTSGPAGVRLEPSGGGKACTELPGTKTTEEQDWMKEGWSELIGGERRPEYAGARGRIPCYVEKPRPFKLGQSRPVKLAKSRPFKLARSRPFKLGKVTSLQTWQVTSRQTG